MLPRSQHLTITSTGLQDNDNGLQLRELQGRLFKNECLGDFPGSTVDKNPPVNAGDTGSTPRPGGFHMLQTNEAHTPQLLSLHAATTETWPP